MVLLSLGLNCLPFYKVPYNQQVSLESSQAIVFKLELQLLPLGRVFLTISFRLWGIGLLKLTCYMCVLQCKPSFLSQDDLLSRYELLYPSFGLLFWVLSELSICLWGSGFQGRGPLFSYWFGVGARDWVAQICQPWEQPPARSWLPIVEAPGCLRYPTSTLQGS